MGGEKQGGKRMTVLIVGGGIGGMSAALALDKIGAQVHLIDIDPQWRVYGAGITITGPTLRAFEAIGIYDEIAGQGYVGQDIQVCSVSGEPLRRLPTPMLPGATTEGSGGIMRPTLHKILSDRVRATGIKVSLGVTVDQLEQDENGVSVHFSDGGQGRYDLLLGADGVYSRVRELIFPNAPKPEYTGQSAWRLTTVRSPQVDCRHYFLGGPHKVGFTPVSADEMYMFVLERTPQRFRQEHELPEALKALLSEYGGLVADVREQINADSQIVFRPLEAFFLPAPWYVGRVLLIGDAAHPTTPQLASGAGIAVEDGLVLAEEMMGTAQIDDALARFMARREQRCRLVVESSIEIGRLEQVRAPVEAQTAVVNNALSLLSEPI